MLCTLAQVKAEALKATDFAATSESDLLNRIRMIEGWVRRAVGIDFLPSYKSQSITAYSRLVNSYEKTLQLPAPLLELDSVTNDGTTLVINTDVYAHPLSETPIRYLRLDDTDCCLTWYPTSGNSVYSTVTVAGFWGWRRNYDTEGFIDTQVDVPAGNIAASATSMTLSDVDGLDALGYTPAFSAGNIIRIEDELIEVLTTNTSTNAVTMRRGIRGSTAAAHTAGVDIKVWKCEPGISESVAFDVANNFAQKGLYTGKMTTGDGGTMTFAQFLTGRTYSMLQGFAQV